MLLELLVSSIIQTQTGNYNDRLNNNDNHNITFRTGSSNIQLQSREAENRTRETLARGTRVYERGQSYTQGEAKLLYQDKTNNCVLWAKAQTGTSTHLGNGGRAGINSQTPKVGAVAVEKRYVHASVIVAINGDMITIHESNFIKWWITERTLKRSEFMGFII